MNKPRCVLLAGSARGGTSWALKVLDSHPAVHGSHEPFYQLDRNQELSILYNRIKAGQGTAEDIAVLTQQLSKACIETHKPPFFRKDFLKTPAWLRTATWMSARTCPPLKSAFNYLATGTLTDEHCIVIKNRPFPMFDRILETIQADALVLLRHPCGVVSSWLRGIRMGVMQGVSIEADKVWSRYSGFLEPLGFCEADLQRMSPAGMLALNWLVDITLFSQFERSPHMKTRTIVYCDLVRNPMQEWSKVFDWLHLPFDSSVESFLTQSSKPAFDIRRLMGKKYSYFSVQRGAKSPAAAWRNDMTAAEIKEVMSIVTPHFPVEQYWPDSLS
jgi:hypothetical protein